MGKIQGTSYRCSFAQGEEIFGAGSQSFDCYVIVLGDVCIMDVSTDEPTEFVAPCHVTELKRDGDGLYQERTSEGDVAIGQTMIIATGVSYRLLDVEGSNDLLASGIYYNAMAVEARMCKGWPVHVIGAGNSAGQAAMFLTQYARKVTLVETSLLGVFASGDCRSGTTKRVAFAIGAGLWRSLTSTTC